MKVFFYPRRPDVRHSIWRILDILNIEISTINNAEQLGFLGDGNTYCDRLTAQDPCKIINSDCIDISKSKVDACFHEAFGYSIAIDPKTYMGVGVKKSELNYKHDGEILTFPIKERQSGYVYNKLISNLHNKDLVLDIRIPIIGKSIPLVFLRYRPITNRFSDDDSFVEIAQTNTILNVDEIVKILKFCKLMQLDFGELDAIRHMDEGGRLYIVDANRTPASPPRKLSFFAGHKCMKIMSDSFAKEFLNPNIRNRIQLFYKIRYQIKRPYLWLYAICLALYRLYRKPTVKQLNLTTLDKTLT